MALGQKEIGRRVSEYTSGIATSASDLMLFAIKYTLDLQDAGSDIAEIGFSSLKRSLTHLKSKGLVTENHDMPTGFDLTEEGQSEILRITPSYDEQRNWDGKVYLINYDLPVTKNTVRNAFRDFIKDGLNCGMLQHSLWLTCYDPREKLMKYISENDLSRELVIVSAVNLETEMYPYQIPGLINQSFNLSDLNSKYQWYVGEAESTEKPISRSQKIFKFLQVLKHDPQVPYDLIPENWAGYRAYEIFKEAVQQQ